MKILYVGMKYDYGDPTRGSSFEHNNFYGTLSQMTEHEVVYFPFDEVMREQGRDGMNVALLRAVQAERPELVFFLFMDEMAPAPSKKLVSIAGRSHSIGLRTITGAGSTSLATGRRCSTGSRRPIGERWRDTGIWVTGT